MKLARELRSIESRFGYVFHGSDEFYCAFRPTLSMPKGVTDYEQIRGYTAPKKNLNKFLKTATKQKSPMEKDIEQVAPILSKDELCVIEALKTLGGTAKSKRQLAHLVGFKGREKILRVVSELEEKGYLETEREGSSVVVKLSIE
jgi:hypothetical protein